VDGAPDTAFFLAQSLVGEGRYHEAVIALQRAASIYPDHRVVLASLGWALLQDGQLTEARKTFERPAAIAKAANGSPESNLTLRLQGWQRVHLGPGGPQAILERLIFDERLCACGSGCHDCRGMRKIVFTYGTCEPYR
jgi:hypothetical protein